MATKSFGSITLVDITDVGSFTVYPMSNSPLSVIYDPDQNIYTPDWSSATTHLQITPVVYYAGQELDPETDSYLTITWKRKEGSNGETNLISGESKGVDGTLEVRNTTLSSSVNMITYVVTAEYNDPSINRVLTAKGQVTFNLVRNASQAKTATITGESAFKYNGAGEIQGASTITLTGTVNSVTISAWKYQSGTSNGEPIWTDYPVVSPATVSDVTLLVRDTDAVFINDKATIKLETSDTNTYDIFTIVKLKDGASGNASVSAVLTNDFQFLPANSDGVIPSSSFTDATTQVKVFEGGTDKTVDYAITLEKSSNDIQYTASATQKANDTVHVTAMTADTGYITFTCRKGSTTLVKNFSLSKVESGADGKTPTIYSLEPSVLAVNKAYNADKTIQGFTPSTVTFNSYSITGTDNGTSKTAYNGRMVIYVNGDSSDVKYTSQSDESTCSFTVINCSTITCELYKSGGTSNLLDTQTIVVTSDGFKGDNGQKGEKGDGALSIIVGNEADVIPCKSNNVITSAMSIHIPFYAYQGTERTGASVTVGTINGFSNTPTVQTTATSASVDGDILIQIPANTTLTTDHGTIPLTFIFTNGSTTTSYYSWTRSTAATNGVNAKILQLFTPSGYIFKNNQGSLTIKAQMTDGSQDVNSRVTSWVWEKFVPGSGYQVLSNTANQITGVTTSEITVYGSYVDSYMSFRCTATYDGTPYVQYYALMDKSDPLQVDVLSSVGEQIVNGNAVGALYCRVVQNGVEIDPMPSLVFSESAPSAGLYYYHLNTSNKSVQLKHRTDTSSAWTNYTQTLNADYTWSFRDKDGNVITSVATSTGTFTLPTTGKVIYIDADLINKKIVADVAVTYPKP